MHEASGTSRADHGRRIDDQPDQGRWSPIHAKTLSGGMGFPGNSLTLCMVIASFFLSAVWAAPALAYGEDTWPMTTPPVPEASAGTDTGGAFTPETPLPPTVPPALSPYVHPSAPAAAEEAPVSHASDFMVTKIVFKGNSVVQTDELAALAKPYENRRTTLAGLAPLKKEIVKLYRSRGYILARVAVPPQNVSGRSVTMVISEGHFGTVKVVGNNHFSSEFIERMFSPAKRFGAIRELPMQHALLLMNEIPDLSVKSVLVAGKEPGTSDVILNVKDEQPLHIGVDYNNFGNKFIGQNRAGVSLSGGNLFTDADLMTLRAIFPFPSSSQPLYLANYVLPVDCHGNRLGVGYANAVSTLGDTLAVLDIRAQANIYNLSLQHPMARTLKESTNLSAAFTAKDVQNYFLGTVPTARDELRLLSIGFDGNYMASKARTAYSVGVTQGLGTAFGGLPDTNILASRVGAGNEFSKFTGDLFAVYNLAKTDFLIFHGAFQLSTDPLTVSELFALGGPDSVRGFQQSEFLGDQGYNVTGEYRHSVIDSHDFHLQLAAFIDQGQSSLEKPQVGEVADRNLAAAGVGARFSIGKSTSARLDLGYPISGKNATDDNNEFFAQIMSRW